MGGKCVGCLGGGSGGGSGGGGGGGGEISFVLDELLYKHCVIDYVTRIHGRSTNVTS